MSVSSEESESEGYKTPSDVEEEEEEELPCLCPFCTRTLVSAKLCFEHLRKEHQFDFFKTKRKLGLDFYGGVKLVNFLRKNGEEGRNVKIEDLADDALMIPVKEGDALILGLDEEDEEVGPAEATEDEATRRIRELTEELERVKDQFDAYKQIVSKEFQKDLKERMKSDVDYRPNKAKLRDDDTYYFESYSGHKIHEVMLKDTIRTDAYRDFVYENKDLFAGKTVLDVGTGTGVLSMFCAKAGAAHVYSVDNSDVIDIARQNIIANKLEKQITLIKGKVEEVELPVKQVDIIISEWMGYCLLYEAMLDSVLYARDKYLAPGGLMVPSHTSIHITPVNSEDYVNSNINFWHDVYGFNMSAMQLGLHDEVDVTILPASAGISPLPDAFYILPHHTITTSELEFTKPFSATFSRDADSLDAFAISFETFFCRSPDRTILPSDKHTSWPSRQRGEVSFSTAMPEDVERDSTHWQQGICRVKPENGGAVRKGEVVSGEVTYTKAETNSRELVIEVKWEVGGEKRRQKWFMR